LPVPSSRAKKRGFRSEWKNFLWCFVAAAVLWLFTALNEQYTSSIIVAAKYINYPKDKVFLRPLPDNFKLMITAKGWDLMSNYYQRKAESITIDLNDYRKTDVLIVKTLQDKFSLLMSQKITIGDVYPETISLIQDEKGSKKVPVRLKLDIGYKDQFGLGGEISYTPDSITITGPDSILRGIDHVDTRSEIMKNLERVSNYDINLKDPDPKNITYSPDIIKVQIPVYQLSEKKIIIPVQVINKPLSDTFQLIPVKVSVIYQVPVNKYSMIDPSQFQAIVDGSQIDTINREPLKVQLITQPKYTYNIRLNPDFVDFLIKKK